MPSWTYLLSVCSSTVRRLLQRLQRGDRRHQFHAVVGGVRLAALEFLLVLAVSQDRAPAARTGIARAGAVGVDDDVRPFGHALVPSSWDDSRERWQTAAA